MVVVLRTMARADELVLGGVPWDDATKVGADTIDPVGCKSSVALHNKIGRISLQGPWSLKANVRYITALIMYY